MARPSKYETHVAPRLSEVADWVRNGATDEEVAKMLGIAYSTLREYKNEFSAFSAVLKETKDYVDAKVENALLESALKGNITAQIFWLKNRRPERWRDKPKDNENKDDEASTKIEVSFIDASGESEDETTS